MVAQMVPDGRTLTELVEDAVRASERAAQALKKAQRLQSAAEVRMAAVLLEVAAQLGEEAR